MILPIPYLFCSVVLAYEKRMLLLQRKAHILDGEIMSEATFSFVGRTTQGDSTARFQDSHRIIQDPLTPHCVTARCGGT